MVKKHTILEPVLILLAILLILVTIVVYALYIEPSMKMEKSRKISQDYIHQVINFVDLGDTEVSQEIRDMGCREYEAGWTKQITCTYVGGKLYLSARPLGDVLKEIDTKLSTDRWKRVVSEEELYPATINLSQTYINLPYTRSPLVNNIDGTNDALNVEVFQTASISVSDSLVPDDIINLATAKITHSDEYIYAISVPREYARGGSFLGCCYPTYPISIYEE